MLGGLILAWRVQRPLSTSARACRGGDRRFTGSYEAASFAGNAFPTTSWVADDPAPLDDDPNTGSRWRADLARPLFALRSGSSTRADELVATLDCTGGFYSSQNWNGVRLGRLLDRAQHAGRGARTCGSSRVTGYR